MVGLKRAKPNAFNAIHCRNGANRIAKVIIFILAVGGKIYSNQNNFAKTFGGQQFNFGLNIF